MSNNDNILSQSGVEFSADTALTLNRLGFVAFKPSLGYRRTNTPQFTPKQDSYNEHLLRLGLDALIQPEGGSVFTSKLGYSLSAYFLEQFDDFNRQTHTLSSHTRWNFLFQTALLVNLDWSLVNYSTASPSVQSGVVDPAAVFSLTNVNSSPLRASAGLSSLLFNRLDLRLLAGYAYTFYDQGANDHLLLMHASVGYQWADQSKTRVGYIKDFADTTFGNYYTFHRIFAQWDKSFFDKRLGTSFQTNIDLRDYTGVEGTPARDEVFTSLSLGFDWRFIDAFRAGVRYQLTLNSTDFGVNLPTTIGTVVTFADYTKHLLFFNASYIF